jgi:hypothetical protein
VPEPGNYWGMFDGARSKARPTLGVGVGFLAIILACSIPMTPSFASGAASPRVGSPTLLGSLVAIDDSSTSSWGRDGGITVPLPNGQDLWVFADTPRWQFKAGRWQLSGDFIRGSTAGMMKYTTGQRPTARFLEVIPGRPLAKSNKAHQFMANPSLYLPDGSGKPCNKRYGGSAAESVRWPTGAALLPDKTNVFIPYVDVCVLNLTNFVVQGWGFSFYDWKTNKLSIPPFDVFKPQRNGAGIPLTRVYGSPVVVGKTVTLYTLTMAPQWTEYATTVPTSVAAFRNIAKYPSTPLAMPATFSLSVAARSKYQSKFTMYTSTNTAGGYRILTASSTSGPWTSRATGTMPKCNTSPQPCSSFAIHPELSSRSKLIVSYYLPGSGPTIAGHPDRFNITNFAHIVWASIPI